MDALGIQELPDDVGGLQEANGGQVLSHGPIVVMLAVQVVTIPALYLCTAAWLGLHACQTPSHTLQGASVCFLCCVGECGTS